jgi:hypothetical protein
MEPADTNPFDSLSVNNPEPNTVLDSKYLDPDYLFSYMYDAITESFKYLFSPQGTGTLKAILFYFALFFLTVIIYTAVRLFEIRKKEHAHLHHEMAEYAHHMAEKEKAAREREGGEKNERWSKVLEYTFSPSEGDWRLAVLEADMMLEGLMDQLGFRGETLGEKLKAANQDTFKGLTKAWEAHTIRNRIAHEGSDFVLSSPEAKRVIALYEDIFKEYGFI